MRERDDAFIQCIEALLVFRRGVLAGGYVVLFFRHGAHYAAAPKGVDIYPPTLGKLEIYSVRVVFFALLGCCFFGFLKKILAFFLAQLYAAIDSKADSPRLDRGAYLLRSVNV